MQNTWQCLNDEDAFSCTIIEKGTEEIYGFCQFKNIDTHIPEMSIDVRDGYMGKGYAKEAVRL